MGIGKYYQFTASLDAIQQHKEDILLLQLLICHFHSNVFDKVFFFVISYHS